MYKTLKGFTWSMVSKEISVLGHSLSFQKLVFPMDHYEFFMFPVCLHSFSQYVYLFVPFLYQFLHFHFLPCLLEDDVIDFKLQREVTLNELDTSEKHCVGSTRSSGTWV